MTVRLLNVLESLRVLSTCVLLSRLSQIPKIMGARAVCSHRLENQIPSCTVWHAISVTPHAIEEQHGVALTVRNTTGPPRAPW